MNAGCGQVSVETVAAIVDAFKRPDVGAIMGYRADDAARVRARGPHPWGRKSEGAAAVGEALTARFRSIHYACWEDGGNWLAGDVGVSEWTLTGTTATGETLELLGCDLWRFRDGKAVRKDTYWKHIDEEFT